MPGVRDHVGRLEEAGIPVDQMMTFVGHRDIRTANAGTSFYGVMDLGKDVNETVASLRFDGKAQPAGTYGSAASAATHKLDHYFSGPGILTITSGGAVE